MKTDEAVLEEEPQVLDDDGDEGNYDDDDSYDQQEEETVVEDTPEPPEQAAGAEPVVEDVPVPAWMSSIIQPAPVSPPAPQQVPTQPTDLRDTIFDEDTQNIISKMVDERVNAVRAETKAIAQRLEDTRRREAQQEVTETLNHVHKNMYNDIFKNDSTFQGNEEIAEFLDDTIQNFMRTAAIEAVELNDFNSLRMAKDPRFGRVVAAMVKEMKGVKSGKTPPIKIKGGEVESSTPAAAGNNKAYKISPEVRAELKRYGITETQHLKDLEITGNDFSDYDND